jgi:hypothetical protein
VNTTGNTIHKVVAGDTLNSLVARYRLSSPRAILDAKSNAPVRTELLEGDHLPVDLIIHIPPNAEEVLRRRMDGLLALKPVLLAHFNTLQELTIAELLPALASDSCPYRSDEVSSVLYNLGEFSLKTIEQVTASSIVFVELATAMSLTHVATRDDQVLGSRSGIPAAGLNWAISENGLNAWKSLWDRNGLGAIWAKESPDDVVRSLLDYQMTVRSIVVQHVDRRFRESLLLRQKLQAE